MESQAGELLWLRNHQNNGMRGAVATRPIITHARAGHKCADASLTTVDGMWCGRGNLRHERMHDGLGWDR